MGLKFGFFCVFFFPLAKLVYLGITEELLGLFFQQCFKEHPRSRLGEPRGMQKPKAFATHIDVGAISHCAEVQLTQSETVLSG